MTSHDDLRGWIERMTSYWPSNVTRISQQATSCQFQMADNFSCPSTTSKSPLLNHFSIFVGDSGICSKQPHHGRQGERPPIMSLAQAASVMATTQNLEINHDCILFCSIFISLFLYFSYRCFKLTKAKVKDLLPCAEKY